MTTIRELISVWLDTRLAAIPGLAEYERDPSGDPTDFPYISFTDNGQKPSETEAGVTRYDFDGTIEFYSEGPGGAVVSAQLNEYYGLVLGVLMEEPLVGGLVETFEEGGLRRATAHLASTPRKGFALDFTYTFPTRRGDPSAQ